MKQFSKTKILSFSAAIFFGFYVFTNSALAATINAASCSQADVQAAVNAARTSDTIIIPIGTCAWTTTISWNAPANVTLKGSGNLSTIGGGDATIIIDNVLSGTPLMSISTNITGTFRLAGLTIRGGTGAIKENGIIAIYGTSAQVRIDHNHINKSTYSVQNNEKLMILGGTITGVVDHNLFDPGPAIGWIHIVNGNDGGAGDAGWAAATGFGTANFIFLEDNQLNGVVNTGFSPPTYLGTLTDCHTSGRYVARFNTIIAGSIGQTHPTGHAGHDRGCRAHEIYGNTVTSPYNPTTEQPNFAFEYTNSGPSLVWGNSFGGVFKNILYLNVIRRNSDTYSQSATPNGWGYCGTEFNGTGSNWDQNTNSLSGYPCLDQPGRGQGDLLAGDFPNEINLTTGTITWPHQALEPIYEWFNSGNIVTGWGGAWVANQTPGRIAENRDYYLYHNNTSCNQNAIACTAGVGSGTLAQRPPNCTTGTAWWATDQGGDWNTTNATANDGNLYKCTTTNNWESYYTPFSYPHPLTLISGTTTPTPTPTPIPDTTPPAAPNGVTIQ